MSRLEIRSFLISCEIECIISVSAEKAVKPRGFQKDLSQFMNGILTVLTSVRYLFNHIHLWSWVRHSWSSSQNYKGLQRTTALLCRPRRTCDAASKQRPRSGLEGCDPDSVYCSAICLSRFLRHITIPEAFHLWWKEILDTIRGRYKDQYHRDLRYPGNKNHTTLQGAFNPKILGFMGPGSSALLAHLACICISGQVTEMLQRGHRPASEAARGEQEAGRDDAVPVVPLPTETRLEPCTALRLLHRGERECGSFCVCVRGAGEARGQLWTPLSIRDCLPQPPAWETQPPLWVFPLSLLVHLHPPPLLPLPGAAGLWPGPVCHLWRNKIPFHLLCWEALSWRRLLHQTMTLPLSPSQLLFSLGAGTLAVYCISAGLILPGRCFVMTASPEESTGINMQLICI